MKDNGFYIRPATIDDAEGKGYVHYKSWLETYTGHFSEEVMKRISLERSIQSAKDHPENTFVALVSDQIVGFACFMEARDDDVQDAGEIMAIYILKEYQNIGIGKALMNACYHALSTYKKLVLWVLKSNTKAIQFYENEGFIKDGKIKFIHHQETIRMTKLIV